MRDFTELKPYKKYKLYQIEDGGVVWADNGGWLDCVFDTVETAHVFIDLMKKFTDNVYNVIAEAQKKAIANNNGYVSVDIIKEFELRLTRCASHNDGECFHKQCPQIRDNEPETSGRHCPIDNWTEDEKSC